MKCTVILPLALAALSLTQAAPAWNPYQAISSPIDISGHPVREKRASYPYEDSYLCYPKSVVYSYHSNPNYLDSHRRSYVPHYDFEARQARADKERAEFTDYFGK